MMKIHILQIRIAVLLSVFIHSNLLYKWMTVKYTMDIMHWSRCVRF